jgi:hypothetical protein
MTKCNYCGKRISHASKSTSVLGGLSGGLVGRAISAPWFSVVPMAAPFSIPGAILGFAATYALQLAILCQCHETSEARDT